MEERRGSARAPKAAREAEPAWSPPGPAGPDAPRGGRLPRNVGPYRLDRVVHERGLLATYRAEHVVTKLVSHVRTAAPSVALTDRLRRMLTREAKLLARAEGLRVARLLEVDPLGGYYAMEDPRGPTVRQALARVSHEVPALAAMTLVTAMVDAVAVVHARGVVHAGLDPSAFSITARDVVALAGFDRARERDASPDPEDDHAAAADGSEPSYTAPEVLIGEAPTPASDVFSLGVIAYEICAGAHPFAAPADGRALASAAGADKVVGHRIRSEKAPPIPESRAVPIDLERVIQRALSKQPAHRPPSAVEFAAELGLLRAGALGDDAAARDDAWRAFSARLGVGAHAVTATTDAPEGDTELAAATSVRPVAVRLAVVLAAMIAVGVALFLAERGVVERAGEGKSSRGSLKILAHPWAEVWLDGDLLDTTPIGRPVDVAAGKHELVFKHPRATDVRRVVEVSSGAKVIVEVNLDVSTSPDRPAPTPPPASSSSSPKK